MKERTDEIRKELDESLKDIDNINSLGDVRTKFLGKKGLVTELTSNMKDLDIEQRKELGRVSNEIKKEVTERIDSLYKELEEKALNEKLMKEKIHIQTKLRTEIEILRIENNRLKALSNNNTRNNSKN